MHSDEFQSVLETVRRFIREEVVPREDEIEELDEIPEDLRKGAADMGLFGYALPTEFDGLGLTVAEDVRLALELGWTTPAFRSMFGTNNGIAGQVIARDGTDEQRQKWLPRLATGEVVASFALTEAEAGSDAGSLTTSARREGDEWVLDGAKRYITNAPLAGLFVVFARTGDRSSGARGISTFFVEADRAGVTVGDRDTKMGQSGAWTADVNFDGVRVPDTNLVGEEGEGFKAAMSSLNRGRLHIAAVCCGMAERLIDESARYASQRTQFGQAIGEFQLVQAMLADSQAESYAGRSMVLDAASTFDTEEPREAATKAACCKYFCAEMVGRVADRAVQIHGGSGYIRGFTVERFYRDARLFRLYEGTSQIQQVVIARNLLQSV